MWQAIPSEINRQQAVRGSNVAQTKSENGRKQQASAAEEKSSFDERCQRGKKNSGRRGIRTPGTRTHAGFQNRCLKPDSAIRPEFADIDDSASAIEEQIVAKPANDQKSHLARSPKPAQDSATPTGDWSPR